MSIPNAFCWNCTQYAEELNWSADLNGGRFYSREIFRRDLIVVGVKRTDHARVQHPLQRRSATFRLNFAIALLRSRTDAGGRLARVLAAAGRVPGTPPG